MIYTKDGTPLGEALATAAIQLAEYRARQRAGRPANYLRSADGKILYTVGKDKLGDPFRVFRQEWRERPGAGSWRMREFYKQLPVAR
jgi:hypothetical protein